MIFNAQKHWDKSHEGHPKDRLPSNYAVDKESSFPTNSIICDLGGGDGADSFYFLKEGHLVQLFDISDSALNTAKVRAERENFESKLITTQIDLAIDQIPVEENFFDILYSRLSLHYFPRVRMAEIFRDIYRVLKTGGSAYIVVKSPEDKREMDYLRSNSKETEEGLFIDEEGMIKTRFSKEQYKKILDQAGIINFEINDYVEKFGDQKTYVKSKADELLYIEIVIKK